jgi:hypothetical protein
MVAALAGTMESEGGRRSRVITPYMWMDLSKKAMYFHHCLPLA